MKKEATNLKRRIKSLLLRHGRESEKSKWTKGHREWLRKQRFEERGTQLGYETLLEELDVREATVARLEADIEAVAKSMQAYDLIRALQAFKGIKLLTAATIVAELGDLRRFPSAGKLMSFIGLTPSEHSSGERQVRGPITRAGNGRLRRMIVEAAWAYWRTPHVGRELAARSVGVSPRIRDISWSAQKRLNRRLHRLNKSGKPAQKALIAVAREFTGFIWAIGQERQLVELRA